MMKYFSLLRRRLPEFLFAVLLVALALSYGTFAMVAAQSARGGDADVYLTGANPWVADPQGQPPVDHRLAFRAPPSAMP